MKACVVFIVFSLAGVQALLAANLSPVSSSAQIFRSAQPGQSGTPAPISRAYRLTFLDSALYTSVLAYRAMDYFSSLPCLHSRYCGEAELPHAVVATRPGFAVFEVGMAATEIGSSWWLHRHGRGNLARAMDVFSISTGTWGVVHNYSVPKYD